MNRFQVLDRSQDIQKSYLLEASAGTGKTFSIENIVVRLLVENSSISIDQILVVTFTRAATRELRMRIHANLEKVCTYLKNCLENRSKINIGRIDYLEQIVENGPESIRRALRKLEQTIASFDLSQIATIHGFCSKMLNENVLEANYLVDAFSEEESFPKQRTRKIIRDYFRAGIGPKILCEEQLERILANFGHDDSALEEALLNVLSRGMEVESAPDYQSLVETFICSMREIKESLGLTADKIVEDFILLAPFYEKNNNIKRKLKPEHIERVQRFACLFDKNDWDAFDFKRLVKEGVSLLDYTEVRIKVGQDLPLDQLHYPYLREMLIEKIVPKICFETAFQRMAYDCRQYYLKAQDQEEIFSYNDILKSMCEALKNESFVANVRKKYRAAIIDEFQDTDPLQWDIFQKVFLGEGENRPILFLVGDPKQSIYAFRQADIYTYLHAGAQIGKENHASLDTNFRSQKSLINALNTLFCESSCPGFLYLPKLRKYLPYPEVQHAEQTKIRKFKDNKGSLHFFIAEEKSYSLPAVQNARFFPFIVQEIQHLTAVEGFRYNQIAILVATSYQAKDVSEFLKKWKIPSITQKSNSLFNSPAYSCLREVLEATLNPKNESLLKIALGGKIIGWTHEQVRSLDILEKHEEVIYQFHVLQEVLLTNGFASYFQQLLNSSWHNSAKTVIERLMSEEHCEEFFDHLIQVADLLLELDPVYTSSPESLLLHLSELKSLSEGDEEQFKKISDPTQNSVQIVTIHSSKGLEFDVVFSLGLIKRDSERNGELIPVDRETGKILSNNEGKSCQDYLKYYLEEDSEKMRRLYVAMTRAKYRLYNPVLYVESSKKVSPGMASPMEIFLAKLGQNPPDEDQVYSRILDYNVKLLKSFIEALPVESSITYSVLNEKPLFLEIPEVNIQADLFPPPNVSIPGLPKFIHSFTSISENSRKQLFDFADNLAPPHDFDAPIKTQHTLPSGSETGILLHKCLQTYPFEKFRDFSSSVDLEEFVSLFTKGTDYENWIPVISKMLLNASRTVLNGIRFSDLSEEHCFRECEFLYPSEFNDHAGYIKGFIDLLFEHNGKYYLLDWKSNWLGPSQSDYNQDNLKKTMQDHHYFLQASLYADALRKYLRIIDQRPFEDLFGGFFYIFIRGLDPELQSNHGIYFFKERN